MGEIQVRDITAKLSAFNPQLFRLDSRVDCFQGIMRMPVQKPNQARILDVYFSLVLQDAGERSIGVLWEYTDSDLVIPVQSHSFYKGDKTPDTLVMLNMLPIGPTFPAYMFLRSDQKGFAFASRFSREGQSAARVEYFPFVEYNHKLNQRSTNLLYGLREAQKRNSS